MILGATIWLIISHLKGLVLGYCLYGNRPECAFQCHCAVESECSGGVCPSGCKAAPLGYNWRGPACQIGNVALHKKVNQTVWNILDPYYPAKGAVDGVVPHRANNSCAMSYKIPDIGAQLDVDLGDIYKILSIIIYPASHSPHTVRPFTITVYNTSTKAHVCATYDLPILRTYYNVTCNQPSIGRYVHYVMTGSHRRLYICEMIILGHIYRDCSQCPTGISCNDITGCTKCQGSYPPNCRQKCTSGLYGTNCESKCGKCKNSLVCDTRNGTCYDGCESWWAPPTCDAYIEIPNHTKENLKVDNTTTTSVSIEWEHIHGISEHLKDFYGYKIEYKEAINGKKYTLSGEVNYKSDPHWTIGNLESNTLYEIKLTSFRKYETMKEYGIPYEIVKVKTDKMECKLGFYGTNCESQCGKCKNVSACDDQNGTCYGGCQAWWTDTKCDTYIEMPNHTKEDLKVVNTTKTSVSIEWEHIRGIPEHLKHFYGYKIEYREAINGNTYISGGETSYKSQPHWTIDKLKINTLYEIRLTPFRKYGKKKEYAAAYDIVKVETGHMDCSRCPTGVKCDLATGCDECHGSYPPECKQECKSGFYGTNCESQCGKCKNVSTCDRQNGTCYGGCQTWWTDTKCDTFIEMPNHTKEDLKVVNTTKTSVSIEWEHIHGIPEHLQDFYGYKIEYREAINGSTYTLGGETNYKSQPHWTIDNLKINTLYEVRLKPFRKYGKMKQFAAAYDIVKVKTDHMDCSRCPTSVKCDLATGCDECHGSYPPECKQECKLGFYGTNCESQCGKCNNASACDRQNGTCYGGCQTWWTDTKCDTFIEIPNHTKEDLKVVNTTKASVSIEWEHIHGIPEHLKDFYGYKVEYKEAINRNNYTSAGELSYKSQPRWTIENLKINTLYEIRLTPFRKYGKMKLYAAAYEILKVKTDHMDCSRCPTGMKCDLATGCDECHGSYPPECKQECKSGFYGTNCESQCGKCNNASACDRQNGTCYGGCQTWWTDAKCDTFIEIPNHTKEDLKVVNTTKTSVSIEWEHIHGIPEHLKDFYGYKIEYKEAINGDNYTSASELSYKSGPHWTIDNLKINTLYEIRLTPFRKYGKMKQYAAAYEILKVETDHMDCSRCPTGVKCDLATGCDECHGSYPPECKQECKSGFYGTNCESQCGKCNNASACDRQNGTCYGSCRTWWTDTNCDTYIEMPNHTKEDLKVVNTTKTSVSIEWEHIHGIPEHLKDFYGYKIEYKEAINGNNYTSAGELSYKSQPHWTIDNLKINTLYEIRLTPFRKYGKMKQYAAPYEILKVETGNMDCSRCPTGVKCDLATGCDECHGSYPPECKQECKSGFYGTNCESQCGKCNNASACDRQNGTCYSGCQTWWTDTKCDTYIEIPNHTKEDLKVVNTTKTSVSIEWEHIHGIPEHLKDFYGYKIEYKEAINGDNYTSASELSYKSGPHWTIDNLKINTLYEIRLTPFRKYGKMKQYAAAYEILKVETDHMDCSRCPTGVKCDLATGCDECHGSYPPECKQECKSGFYGTNCESQCGKCNNASACDRQNGTCYGSCRTWWTDTNCDTYIEMPNHTKEDLKVVNTTKTSVSIEWEHIHGIPEHLKDFYGYKIEYKEAINGNNYTSAGELSYKSQPHWTIDNLKINTIYEIRLTPFRKYGKMKQYAAPYEILKVETGNMDCSRCPTGVKCDLATGCDECHGSYPPECKQECKSGFYGTNCESQCGKCNNASACDRQNGTCYGGCQTWWTDTKCDTFIEMPNHTKEDLKVVNTTKTSVSIEWEHIHGIPEHLKDFYGYKIEYKEAINGNNYTSTVELSYKSQPHWTIENLKINTLYEVKLTPFRKYEKMKEYVTAYEIIKVKTDYMDCSRCPNGVICSLATGCKECHGSYPPECKRECKTGLYGINCKIQCGKCKIAAACDKHNGSCLLGCQLWWINTKCDTYIEIPHHTNESVQILSKTGKSVSIQWQPIQGIPKTVQDFYGYQIQYKEALSSSNYVISGKVGYTSYPRWTIEDLKSYTVYDITLTPFRKHEKVEELGTPFQTLRVKTYCGAPDRAAIQNISLLPNGEMLPNISVTWVTISTIDPHCVNITEIFLLYKLTTSANFTSISLPPHVSSYTIVPHQAGQYHIKLVVMNNYGYKSSSETYTIIIGVPSMRHSSSTANAPAIGGAVSTVLVVSIYIIIILIILWKKRQMNKIWPDPDFEDMDKEDDMKSLLASQQDTEMNINDSNNKDDDLNIDVEEHVYTKSIIPVVKFEDYVRRKIENRAEHFDEYKSLPQPDMSRCQMSLLPCNKPKNGYKGIYPYDDNRVILYDDDSDNDYINASYITGYNMEKEYIATQGVRKDTCVDFWRMVWQEKSNRIVMLTSVDEMNKHEVDCYLPEDMGDSLKVADFNITTQATKKTANYVVRIISLAKGDESQVINHLHFTTWEENGTPCHGIYTLQDFIAKVHSFDKSSSGPMVVQCSSGVGRTGTFIALDILEEMASNEPALDVYGCIQRLRNERMLMVQPKVQYVFLHEALADFIKCGNRSIDCNEFKKTFATVCDPEPDPELLLLTQDELDILNDLKYEHVNTGNLNNNKNNDATSGLFLSSSKTRNPLNHVLVDSFKAHDSYVVTHMPVRDEINDFWQLIIEQGCQAIVMLNDIDRNDKTCPKYWPEELHTKKQYGKVEVEFTSTDAQTFLIIRDLRVSELKKISKSSEVKNIRQFQLLSWPDMADLPPKRRHVLELIESLQKWQRHLGIPSENWKSLVHCFDGSSHSGMFCGASFVLERMKLELDVNAFLAVRYVSRHRPEFITKLDEYLFLYQMAMEKLTKRKNLVNFPSILC